MQLQAVPLRSIVKEWIEDTGREGTEVPEQLIYRWGSSAVKMCPIQDTYKHKVVYLQVKNFKAEMPEDYRLIQQVAARVVPEVKGTNRREKLVQWTRKTFDPDMDLEIRLVCHRCSKAKCECRAPVIELDVDRTWEMAHPEAYLKRWNRSVVVGEGRGTQVDEGWNLLRYAQGDFYRTKHFLSDCPNLTQSTGHHSFSLNLPFMEFDFPEGEVIVSYLGADLDEDGDIMVPDHEDLIEGVKAHINYKWADRLYHSTLGSKTKERQSYRIAKSDAKADREEAFRIYRSAAQIPEFMEFRNWVQRFWMNRFPDHNWVENARDPKNVGTYEKYSKVMDGKSHTRRF